jgi:hypothetical protein
MRGSTTRRVLRAYNFHETTSKIRRKALRWHILLDRYRLKNDDNVVGSGFLGSSTTTATGFFG